MSGPGSTSSHDDTARTAGDWPRLVLEAAMSVAVVAIVIGAAWGASLALAIVGAVAAVAVAGGSGAAWRARASRQARPPIWAMALPLAVAAGPLVMAGMAWWAWEQALLLCVAALQLAFVSVWPWRHARHAAATIGLFLAVLGSLMPGPGWIAVAAVAYAGGGVGWLMLGRGGSDDGRPSGAGAASPSLAFTDERRPVAASTARLVVLLVVAAVAGVAYILTPPGAIWSVRGVAPTSGGASQHADAAVGGLGVGADDMTGPMSPDSVGFGDMHFMESDHATLFDIASDDPTEAFSKFRGRRQSMTVDGSRMRRTHAEASWKLDRGRQFAVRRGGGRDRHVTHDADRMTDALVHVVTNDPVHLPVRAYRRFDGRSWEPDAMGSAPLPRYDAESGAFHWAYPDQPDLRRVSDVAEVTVRYAMARTPALMAPAFTTSTRIADFDETSMLRWRSPNHLALEREIPSSISVTHEVLRLDPRDYRQVTAPQARSVARAYLAEGDAEVDPRVTRLAAEWVGSMRTDWAKVDRLIERLRAHAEHDPAASAPDDAADPLAWFLFESRRGDSAMFASAAAVMLRSQGVACRFVSGFYVHPDQRSELSGEIPVTDAHRHCWVEVASSGAFWLPVEPTPGYELMTRPMPLVARARLWVMSVAAKLGGRPVTVSLLVVGVADASRPAVELGRVSAEERAELERVLRAGIDLGRIEAVPRAEAAEEYDHVRVGRRLARILDKVRERKPAQ